MFKVGDKVLGLCEPDKPYSVTNKNAGLMEVIEVGDTGGISVKMPNKSQFYDLDPAQFKLANSFEIVSKELERISGIRDTPMGKPVSKIIRSEQIVMWDIDDTLVMWDSPIKDIYIVNPHDKKTECLTKHELHIKYLKEHKSRGFTNIIWSAGGYEWAEVVINALELNDYVDLIISKPVKFFDDLPANEVLVNRVYLDYKPVDKSE